MKKAAFSIVAKNYIGLAKILQNSLIGKSSDTDFYIVVADEFEEAIDLDSNIIIGKEFLRIKTADWTDMSFKYDLTEFCTAIKPYSFEFLFKKGYEKVIYFDPDIYVYSSIDPIFEALDNHSAVLTPQVNGIHVHYKGEHPEYAMNLNGIYNMGFCALKNTELIRHFISWWEERLRTMCFQERSMGYFTDQKWIDWLPGFLPSDQLCVSRSLGMNLAPWNFFERKVVKRNNSFFVSYRDNENEYREDPLVFIHFAGYDYSAFKKGVIRRKRISDLKEYEDLFEVQSIYKDAIVSQADLFDSFIDKSYSYNSYDNGMPIDKLHRRIYDGLIAKGFTVKSPFCVEKGSLFSELKKKGLITKNERIDSIKKGSVNIDSKKKSLSFFYRFIYRILGYKKYSLFVRSLIFYSNMKEHSFLITNRNYL